MVRTILASVAVIALTLAMFQNCSKANFSNPDSAVNGSNAAAGGVDVAVGSGSSGDASLLVSASPGVVEVGSSTQISAVLTNLTQVTYSCAPGSGGANVASGSLDPSNTSFSLPISQDVTCNFSGTGPNVTAPVNATVSITVACGAQIKTPAGSCRDFACSTVTELTSPTLDIPARSAAGECFAFKLIDEIPAGASSLTPLRDPDLLSRSHDDGATPAPAHPHLMGSAHPQFVLRGARTVKLAGGVSASARIRVDNFVLAGIFPAGSTPDLAKAYRVTGTADAGILDADGKNTGVVAFDGVSLPVQIFATGGTSSIAPIDISAFVTPNVAQQLDVRALDCGGSRDLSDIYILFQ